MTADGELRIEVTPTHEGIYDSGVGAPFNLYRWTNEQGWQKSSGWTVSAAPLVMLHLGPVAVLRAITDEPRNLGAVVRDVDGELWVRLPDGRWACSHSEAQWSAIEYPIVEHPGAASVRS